MVTPASCCMDFYELPLVEYLLGRSFHPGGPKLTRQLASAVLVHPKAAVLDIGCGNGNSARILAADFGAFVAGCDVSADNLRRARDISMAATLSAQTSFVRSLAGRLAFKEQTFDAVLCECSLCLFGNLDAALREVFRVLKSGGRVGISDFFLNAPVPASLEGLLGQALCIAKARSADELQSAFTRAGFKQVRIRLVNWALTEMMSRVRHKIGVLASAAGPSTELLPTDWGDPAPVLQALERFIDAGGTGYLLVTARKP